MVQNRSIFIVTLFIFFVQYVSTQQERTQYNYVITRSRYAVYKKEKRKQYFLTRSYDRYPWTRKKEQSGRVAQYFGSIGYDIISLHKNIFSWDTFKLISLTFPLFIGSRMVDEKLQRCFYDASCHKNINQMPGWCHEAARWSIGVPMILLGLQSFLARDQEFRITSQMFVTGIPFVFLGKDLIKKFRFEACFRPWHEKFDDQERSCGGFPSGHMAEAVYTTVLYGMRYGPQFAVPLGIISSFVGVTFMTCNRHYLSQLVAGAGFGALYALAANKVIDKKLDNISLSVSMNKYRGPAFCFSYYF